MRLIHLRPRCTCRAAFFQLLALVESTGAVSLLFHRPPAIRARRRRRASRTAVPAPLATRSVCPISPPVSRRCGRRAVEYETTWQSGSAALHPRMGQLLAPARERTPTATRRRAAAGTSRPPLRVTFHGRVRRAAPRLWSGGRRGRPRRTSDLRGGISKVRDESGPSDVGEILHGEGHSKGCRAVRYALRTPT